MTADTSALAASQEREQFIRDVIQARFNRKVTSVSPIPGGLNTFVYAVNIGTSDAEPSNAEAQPGTTALPTAATELVIRMSNPESGLNEDLRVQNEVAVTHLVREALAPLKKQLVPAIYGWAPGNTGKGWTLSERLPGVRLSDKFDSLEDRAKREVLQQIAGIFKLIQQYRLPESIQGYGGLTFAQDGSIVTAPTTIPGGGPSKTHLDLYTECLQTQIDLSKKCGIVQGWTGTDIPARIEKVKERLADPAEWEKTLRPTLVHADLDTHNLLFDPETNQITGLIDFDFGHIGSQADEYFYSFCRMRYLVVPPHKTWAEADFLASELLNGAGRKGNPSATVTLDFMASELLDGTDKAAGSSKGDESGDWKLSRMVDEEFAKAGVERPQVIPGMAEVSLRYWFINNVSPPMYHSKKFREAPAGKREAMRKEAQKELESIMESWGMA